MPVKLLLYERGQGIATLDALKVGVEVEDHSGAPVPINFLNANLCQTIPHPQCTKADHIRADSLSMKGACSQHGHCNYHYSLWIDAIQ